MVLDSNETLLFPDGLLERILVRRFQFRKLACVFGDEILTYGTRLVRILVLHWPFYHWRLSGVCAHAKEHLSWLGLGILCFHCCYVQGKPATTYQTGQPNAITTRALFEMAMVEYFLSKKNTITLQCNDQISFHFLPNAGTKKVCYSGSPPKWRLWHQLGWHSPKNWKLKCRCW